MSYAASFLSCELFLNNRSLGRVGGYFFAIASRYPVATTNKTIASTSVILTHPLSGERYRRRISPAQGRFICIIGSTDKFSTVILAHLFCPHFALDPPHSPRYASGLPPSSDEKIYANLQVYFISDSYTL